MCILRDYIQKPLLLDAFAQPPPHEESRRFVHIESLADFGFGELSLQLLDSFDGRNGRRRTQFHIPLRGIVALHGDIIVFFSRFSVGVVGSISIR